MSTTITRTEVLDEANGVHAAYISVDEIQYKGEITVVYKVDKDGFLFLSSEAEGIVAETGHKGSTIKSMIKANFSKNYQTQKENR